MAFITTSGTLDKKSEDVRQYLAARCDLIGAVRLPNTTFKSNAGTEVTSDILFLQKRGRVLSRTHRGYTLRNRKRNPAEPVFHRPPGNGLRRYADGQWSLWNALYLCAE